AAVAREGRSRDAVAGGAPDDRRGAVPDAPWSRHGVARLALDQRSRAGGVRATLPWRPGQATRHVPGGRTCDGEGRSHAGSARAPRRVGGGEPLTRPGATPRATEYAMALLRTGGEPCA